MDTNLNKADIIYVNRLLNIVYKDGDIFLFGFGNSWVAEKQGKIEI